MQIVKMIDTHRAYILPKDETPEVIFSKQFDGQPIWKVCVQFPEWRASALTKFIEQKEGGSVDSQGIIHKA